MASLPSTAVPLLVLTQWLTQQVADSAWLDMADNAFDDQYVGCTEEMEKRAPQLLREELEAHQKLKTAWEKAAKKWSEIKSNTNKLSDFHGTAVVTYTNVSIAEEFNRAVRGFHQNSHNFPFKAFHYYLTRALELLKDNQCFTVYRGSKTKFYYSGKGNVRFGQFTSSSLSNAVALHFSSETGTIFTIKTCLGVSIAKFSFVPHEQEVLIPGYEVYQKVTVEDTDKGGNRIHLERYRKGGSNYNCYYLSTANSSRYRHLGMREGTALLLLLPGILALLISHAEG
ncbi:T-cell ecto-ADP-ribosyltransferase 2-like [Echinops telfairi]|uniref:T-cell ecto-ADP-ribosyltransferase 2-like n=1 Tax=Echinops telfairi TaxID=9371 RepID=A0AC55DBN7_ECHTE|nr:T-cell ecto-ADP-ribosyltransferase 2-like [Echinops telfairi]